MIVICDVNILPHCHNIGFNQYILDNIPTVADLLGRDESSLCFVFNREASKYLQIPAGIRIEFVDVPMAYRDRLVGSFRIWKIVEKLVSRLEPEGLYFMDFDRFQLAIGFSGLKCPVSGIYCRPHHRIYPTARHPFSGMGTRLKRLKKRFVEQVMVSNRKVRKVFILNDPNGAAQLNKVFGTRVFAGLPDPVFDYPYDSSEEKFTEPGLRLLLFGGLTERKNADQVIRAFGLAGFSRKATLLIVGSTGAEGYMHFLTNLAEESIAGQEDKKSIVFQQAFVSNEEMEIHHANAHVAVLAYRNFYFSSALMGRAAKHNLVVITPEGGLMGELTRQYGLGVTADPEDLRSIAAAMKAAEALTDNLPLPGSGLFYKDHRPEKFLSILFGS